MDDETTTQEKFECWICGCEISEDNVKFDNGLCDECLYKVTQDLFWG